MTQILTLEMLHALPSDPDCVAARNADHGWITTIRTAEEAMEIRFALRNYNAVLERRPHLKDKLQPKIDELTRLLETR